MRRTDDYRERDAVVCETCGETCNVCADCLDREGDVAQAENERLRALLAEREAGMCRLRAAMRELLEDFGHKHRGCIVKTHDDIDSHEWDAWMNKATAYADCENALRATLKALKALEAPDAD